MVDFTKLVGKKRIIDVTDPVELFNSLDRQSSHTTLRPLQAKVLEEIRNRRNERDLILKMSTGAGKTSVALLYLKSHMAEKKRPAVYLSPNTQLIEQILEEASKLGIKADHYPSGVPHPKSEGTAGESVIVCTYNKLFNAKTTFDREDVLLRPCAIVLDDAHAGIEEIRDAFTLRFLEDEIYESLMTLFGPLCEQYMSGKWASILNQDPDEFFEVPYWLWKPIIKDVQRIISPFSDDSPYCFVWPYLRDILRWCRCIISGYGIEIVPDIMPINMVKAFYESNNRMFMSATLADDSVLVRELDCDSSAALNPVYSSDDKGVGERMVLTPALVDKNFTRNIIMKWCNKIATKTKVNIVVLSPSEKMARNWETFGAEVAIGPDVNTFVHDLRSGRRKFVAFAQRYDGIDLSDNACRILVIDGLPYGQGIADKYDSKKLGIPGGTRNRLIYRIEQGMGRPVRSNADYAVIILSGPEIANFISKHDVLNLMNPATRAQLELSLELARFVLEDTGVDPSQALSDMVRQCLNRDESWKQLYNDRVRSLAETISSNVNENTIKLADAEHKAAQAAMDNDPEKAMELVENAMDELIDEEKQKGWMLQKMANYMYEYNDGKALEIQKSAFSKNKTTFRPPPGVRVRPVEPGRFESPALVLRWYKSFANANGAIAQIQNLRVGLSYDRTSNTLEQAIMELSETLGAEGSRPENTYGNGPDDLWLWPNLSLVIEVKNKRNKILTKGDSGQLHDSMQWFKENYPTRTPTPVIIAKVSKADRKANFPSDTRVLIPDKMIELLNNLETFIGNLVKKEASAWTTQEITSLQSQFGLMSKQFLKKYTIQIK